MGCAKTFYLEINYKREKKKDERKEGGFTRENRIVGYVFGKRWRKSKIEGVGCSLYL